MTYEEGRAELIIIRQQIKDAHDSIKDKLSQLWRREATLIGITMDLCPHEEFHDDESEDIKLCSYCGETLILTQNN